MPLVPAGPPSELHTCAYDGDILHKQWLREFGLLPSDSLFLRLVQNVDQGRYLLKFHPELGPTTPHPSPHLLGTYFEFHFSRSLVFRCEYLLRVSVGPSW